MSIYSGFSTRSLEQNYNKLIDATLRILSSRIIRFYEQHPEEDSTFVKLLSKNVNYLAIMEQSKYMPPKFSDSLTDLCNSLAIEMTIPHDLNASISSALHSQQQLDRKRPPAPIIPSTLTTTNSTLSTLSPSNRGRHQQQQQQQQLHNFSRQNSADSPTLLRIKKDLQNQPNRHQQQQQQLKYASSKQRSHTISHDHHQSYMQKVQARVTLLPQRKSPNNNSLPPQPHSPSQRSYNNSWTRSGSASKLNSSNSQSRPIQSPMQRNSSYNTSPIASPQRNNQSKSSSSMYNPMVGNRNRSAQRRVSTQIPITTKSTQNQQPTHNFVLQRVTANPQSPTNNRSLNKLTQNVWDSCSIQKEIAVNFGFKGYNNTRQSTMPSTAISYMNASTIYNQNLIPSAAQKRTRSMLPQLAPLSDSNSAKSFLISPQKNNTETSSGSNNATASGLINNTTAATTMNTNNTTFTTKSASQTALEHIPQVFKHTQLDLSNIEIRTYSIIPGQQNQI